MCKFHDFFHKDFWKAKFDEFLAWFSLSKIKTEILQPKMGQNEDCVMDQNSDHHQETKN